MYSIDWSKIFARNRRGETLGQPGDKPEDPLKKPTGWKKHLPQVSQTVWALGATSLLTDISSEMIASILPLYLVLHLGMSPLAFGLVDGIYQGAAALVRVAGGVLSDRWRRRKEMAAFGYGLSAACRLLIFAAGSAWGSIVAIVALDRIGKGIRTAPRDALISQSTPSSQLALAFGVHRALDAVGAMLGPVVAFALLALLPGSFDVVFVASFGIAVLGVAAILLFVPKPGYPGNKVVASAITAAQLFRTPHFRGLLYAGTFLGLGTISDSFVFLILQRRLDIGVTAFPLLYVGTSLVTSLFAAFCGRLADRIGRKKVLFCGYGALVLLYLSLLLPASGGMAILAAAILLLGLYYAATDGVLTAMAAAVLPAESCGSGLAFLSSATNVARLLASIGYGFVWTRFTANAATLSYLLVLVSAMVSAIFLLRNSDRNTPSSSDSRSH